jgi:hypothetical protein
VTVGLQDDALEPDVVATVVLTGLQELERAVADEAGREVARAERWGAAGCGGLHEQEPLHRLDPPFALGALAGVRESEVIHHPAGEDGEDSLGAESREQGALAGEDVEDAAVVEKGALGGARGQLLPHRAGVVEPGPGLKRKDRPELGLVAARDRDTVVHEGLGEASGPYALCRQLVDLEIGDIGARTGKPNDPPTARLMGEAVAQRQLVRIRFAGRRGPELHAGRLGGQTQQVDPLAVGVVPDHEWRRLALGRQRGLDLGDEPCSQGRILAHATDLSRAALTCASVSDVEGSAPFPPSPLSEQLTFEWRIHRSSQSELHALRVP